MTAVLTSNNRSARDNVAPAPATKEDGSGYAWRMFFDNGQRIADADTLPEIIDVLIPGYAEFTTFDEKFTARFELAKRVQMLARSSILSTLSNEVLENVKDWEYGILAWDKFDDPYGWGDGSLEPNVDYDPNVLDVWSSDVPLVLINTFYQPFTDIATPLSPYGEISGLVKNLIWLKPSDELEFLRSLSRIGYITFGQPAAALRDDPNAL